MTKMRTAWMNLQLNGMNSNEMKRKKKAIKKNTQKRQALLDVYCDFI